MKQIKLYNVIFLIWILLFFPPVIFITLIGNFMIDTLVIIFVMLVSACFIFIFNYKFTLKKQIKEKN